VRFLEKEVRCEVYIGEPMESVGRRPLVQSEDRRLALAKHEPPRVNYLGMEA